MKNVKRVLAVALSMMVCFASLIGCTGNTASGGPSQNTAVSSSTDSVQSASAGKLSIQYLTSRSTDEAVIKALQDIADNYKTEHPGFSYEVESITDRASYLQKLKILASSDELPEWFESDPDTFFSDLVNAGIPYNIEDLYNELGVSDKFFNISKEYARLPDTGKLYLMTWQCNAEYFFYNKDMFKKAGISETPKTMDELLNDCAKLKAAGFTPITTVSGDWPVLRYFAMVPFRLASNDYLIDACAGKTSFGNEVGIAGAEYMQKLAQYFQTGYSSCDYDTMVDLFVGSKAAILYNGTWVLPDVLDKTTNDLRSDFGYFKMPTYSDKDVTGASDYFANSGIGTAVLKDAMNQDMKDYLSYVFSNYADICLSKYNTLPSIKPSSTEKLPQVYQDILKDVTSVNTYAKCWDVVISAACLETLNKASTELCLGEITPQEWAKQLDTVVAENNK